MGGQLVSFVVGIADRNHNVQHMNYLIVGLCTTQIESA